MRKSMLNGESLVAGEIKAAQTYKNSFGLLLLGKVFE
jgi:hypothetical protein